MDYKVVEAGSKEDSGCEVSEHLADGWTLQGGVFVLDQTTMVWRFFQPLVRAKSGR